MNWRWVKSSFLLDMWICDDDPDYMQVIPLIGCVEVIINSKTIWKDGERWPDVETAKAHCNEFHTRRVTSIAAANGYVKLEPGQVVVQAEDLTRIVTWFRGDARTVPHTDMDTTLNRFTAALDASGVGR